ncbi:cholesterol 24-hydroxylase-like isoform X3 [Hyla sarda]|uniref:cholesterol 24-hydroxylase-like isoform X3 n=1 Tax=Hyla sarda TaxID=327740 RepID=UPI0024C2B7DB|nr:cholesterol 24-hydroxylase-like isoform X3 [Hyla sarda]
MGVWSFITGALILLLILVVICFLLYCGYIYYIHMKYDHIPGPPRDSFLFGHSPTIIKIMRNNKVIYDTFLEWVEKYGPVIRINGLHSILVLVVTPEGVKEFLMSPKYTKDNFYKRIETLFGSRFMGTGLVTDRDYGHWHKQRRIMDPAFSRTYLVGLMGTFNEKAEDLVDTLGDKADGKCQVGMHDMLSRVTLDVIAKVAFGMELNSLHDDQTPFPKAISTVMRGMVETRNPLAKYTPGKQAFIRDVRESIKLLRKTGQECIERRTKAIQDGEDIPVDILTQILKGAESEGCSLEDLIDNFVTFFIAGQETTANQLSFAVMELTRHPDILARVQSEVDEVFGSKRDIEYEDLGKLKYLSQVLKETLRLYPTAPGTSRALEEEMVIEGVRIPPRTTLMFNSYIMGRMETFYQDPLAFNPDRFHPDAPKPDYAYFPFSLGPRSCIGQVFAQMEAKVVMAKLLQRFEFELVEGQSFRILDTGTLRPMDGVICRLRHRTEHNPKN